MNKECHFSDLYICDYEHYSENHPEYKRRGVEASEIQPENVSSFYLSNPKSLPFDFVSFDHNPSLFKRQDGSMASHCECMCEAVAEPAKSRWMMLLELKYCSVKNIRTNVEIALRQLIKSCEFLKAKSEPQINSSHRLYFVISHPDNTPTDALDAFLTDPDQLLTIKLQHKAVVLYANSAEIVDNQRLRAL